jgi:predicted permease
VTVNGKPFTVVAVAPRGYRGTQLSSAVDVWMPVTAHLDILPQYARDLLNHRSSTLYLRLIGRLKAGSTPALAETQLRATAARILEGDARASLRGLQPAVHGGFGVAAYQRTHLGDAMQILGAVVGFLLLLACANAANLLLARASGRTSEVAVRRAIGASRPRLVRQLLTESMLLALCAGGAGVAMALGAVRLFEGQQTLPGSPPLARVELHPVVLGFALVLSLLTGLLFSIAPVLTSTKQAEVTLRHGTRAVAGRSRLRNALVVSQIAISLALIVCAGLLLDTLRALRSVPLGFQTDGVVEVSIDPGTHGYEGEAAAALLRDFAERARAMPSVQAAGLAYAPLQGFIGAGIRIRSEGEPLESERVISASANHITPGFLAAAGIELIAGRDFQADEVFTQRANNGVILVSQSVARKLSPEGEVLGRRIDVGWSAEEPRLLEIIGVFRDIRSSGLKEADGDLAMEPFGQAWPATWATLYVRGNQSAEVLAARLQQMARDLDASLPLYDVQPFARRIDTRLAQERMLARLTSLFAVLALVLAAVGLYGVLAFSVQARTREFGVRSALGARPATVRTMVLREALRTAMLGIALGLLAGTQAARVVSSRLWGVQPLDLSVFTTAAALLLVTALLASWIPAWRATRVDPTVALRME